MKKPKIPVNLLTLVSELNDEADMSFEKINTFYYYESDGNLEYIKFNNCYIYDSDNDSLPDNAWRDKNIMKEYLKDRVLKLGQAFCKAAKLQDLLEKQLYLAYIMGELRSEEDKLENIPDMTYNQLCAKITDLGMLVDWE